MYLMYYEDDAGNRVYTLKVCSRPSSRRSSRRPVTSRTQLRDPCGSERAHERTATTTIPRALSVS
jgi:hypothetical protein